ncbi:MAG: M28 family peptidase, partial [Flavobacteriaceae bacterium]|nr:M28 family peptidase [Flavobacteriaceae bacterium]
MSQILLALITISFSISASAQNFQDMVHYLASDQLEGRKPGKTGNELAVKYIENRLQAYGLEGLDQSYRQEFTIFTEMLKQGANELSFGSLASEFEPIAYSLSGDIKDVKVVFVGYGISIPANDPNLKYDDYQGIDVKDKIVVVLTGDPGIGNSNSKFRHPDYINYRSLFYKLKNAIAHGAKGILMVNDPMSITNYPREEAPVFSASEGGGSRFSIIAGKVTNRFINSKLSKGINTLQLQKKIATLQSPNSFILNGKASLSVHLKKKTGRVANVVGVLKGTDPVLAKEVIVLGAHMDHLGHGGESSMDPGHDPAIHNGADDNASGTAMVLKLAEELKTYRPKKTFVFVLFNAEEMGLLGSTHFVDMWLGRYEQTYGKISAMINFDMVGRYDKDISVMGTDSALNQGWRNLLGPVTSNYNFSMKKTSVGSSDHAAFINKKIPALFFTTGAHEDYHRSTDDAEK